MITIQQTSNGVHLSNGNSKFFLTNVELNKIIGERIGMQYFHKKENLERNLNLLRK